MLRQLAVLLLAVSPLAAQSWDSLQSLKPGDRIRVLEIDGTRHDGTFAAVTNGSISLHTEQSEESIERSRIRRVQLRSGARRARNIAIGAAIGLAVGVTVDQTLGAYLRNESDESSGARAITYVAPIGIFGAIAGAFPAYRTVYRQ